MEWFRGYEFYIAMDNVDKERSSTVLEQTKIEYSTFQNHSNEWMNSVRVGGFQGIRIRMVE